MPLQHIALSSALLPPLCQDDLGAGALVVGLDAVAAPAAAVAAPAAAGAAAGVAGRPLPAALALTGQALGMWELRTW